MSEKSDLYNRIDQCNAEIAVIRSDIAGMENEKVVTQGHINTFTAERDTNIAYDISAGDTWRRQLCEAAKEIQKNITEGYSVAIDNANNVYADLCGCIANANQMIRNLEDEIGRCRARIAQIEAEEAAEAARRAAEAAAYRASLAAR